jgi:superfamily II DNA or RNA helicase
MTELTESMAAGAAVQHQKHGQGTVIVADRQTAVVRFVHGIEQVLTTDLVELTSVSEAARQGQVSPSLEVVARLQAEAILSVNDSWGVFSRSRISLLPHQLWVCHRALRGWPMRLLIADDVGMGKTIEAGLILWPLIERRTVQRLLILAPARLVEQWQTRLRRMFDIRAAIYTTGVDNPRADFWGVHPVVIASLPTLRFDNKGRHERLLDAPEWDMVIVDEAHHLNVEEGQTKTLGLTLLEKMNEAGKVKSLLLFTGTPHRGKSFGFWSLMSLLDPSVFGPRENEGAMLRALPGFLIRNAKQKAVDMTGERLFQPVEQFPETFHYTQPEAEFYQLMSEFIVAGKAYASSLSRAEGGQVILVLIALQKLASSSVAAVLAALETRQLRLVASAQEGRAELDALGEDPDDEENAAALDEWLRAGRKAALQLMEDEGRHLMELITAARAVKSETRIERAVEVVRGRFPGEAVLFFTEYKRTQALLVGALAKEFGSASVGFMNGDSRLEGVLMPDGSRRTISANRDDTCERFNEGKIRFLVSTEAGGEGIDLQESCSALVHVDLPWNPMRLHQRVGRLNRYGQKRTVRVVSLRNPDTVESMIWAKLEEKLNSIMRALGGAMEEPEDLMQLVLGMTSGSTFNNLFAGAVGLEPERLAKWFDQSAGTFGGRDAIIAVQDIVGHAASFDLSNLKDVPPVDLPDLLPFFVNALALNRRRPKIDGLVASFRTPDDWATTPAIKRSYEGIHFDRGGAGSKGELMGVGHPVLGKAIDQATRLTGNYCITGNIDRPLLVFSIMDRLTGSDKQTQRLVGGVIGGTGAMHLLRDWEVLTQLNELQVRVEPEKISEEGGMDRTWLHDAMAFATQALGHMQLPFKLPEVHQLGVVWPNAPSGAKVA